MIDDDVYAQFAAPPITPDEKVRIERRRERLSEAGEPEQVREMYTPVLRAVANLMRSEIDSAIADAKAEMRLEMRVMLMRDHHRPARRVKRRLPRRRRRSNRGRGQGRREPLRRALAI